MGSMSSGALATFAIDPGEFANRAQLVLVLLLNAVAYKFAVSSDLPKVPYSTTFDTYLDASIVFLLVVYLESAIVGWPTRYFENAVSASTRLSTHPGYNNETKNEGALLSALLAADLMVEQQLFIDHLLGLAILCGWGFFNLRFIWRCAIQK